MSVKWWFGAFRDNGAPTWYGENRTPVYVDLHITALVSLFAIPSLAFLVILPGLRRARFASAITFLGSMLTGATLLVGVRYPCWQIAHARIYAQYRAFSTQRMHADLGVKVGLETVNITLETFSVGKYDERPKFLNMNFNERFSFSEVHEMEVELTRALQKGMPYPILKKDNVYPFFPVIEYFSIERGGFVWGRQYRMAGYYTMCVHWLAIAGWILSLVYLHILPRLYASTTAILGIIILTGNFVYWCAAPHHLTIRFEAAEREAILAFCWGHCFWASLTTGALCSLGGSLLWLCERHKVYTLDTVFTSRFYRPDLMSDPIYPDSSIIMLQALTHLPLKYTAGFRKF